MRLGTHVRSSMYLLVLCVPLSYEVIYLCFIQQLSEINIGHYDAFLLYANSVNEAIATGINPKDGRKMTTILWNKTFQGNLSPDKFVVH